MRPLCVPLPVLLVHGDRNTRADVSLQRMVASRVYSSLPVRSGPLTLHTAQNHIFLPKDAQGGREIAVASVLC